MGNKRKRAGLVLVALMILGAMMLFQGCDKQGGTKESLTFTTEYQAVLLNNGQFLLGKMEKAGSAYPVLKNVIYIRQQMDPETKQVKVITDQAQHGTPCPRYDVHQRQRNCLHRARLTGFKTGNDDQAG